MWCWGVPFVLARCLLISIVSVFLFLLIFVTALAVGLQTSSQPSREQLLAAANQAIDASVTNMASTYTVAVRCWAS